MRAHIQISTNNKTIPFDHQHLLTGTIHKWLGWNNEHGKLSLYSFSRLEGAKATKNGLQFENSTSFFFSAFDTNLIKQLVFGIQADPSLFEGLTVTGITLQEDPDFSDREQFNVASPIFIKRKEDDRIEHILYTDTRANGFLKETMQTKLKAAGIMDETFDITFDETYKNAGTKKVTYKGIANRANWCHVIIKGKPETKKLIWNAGLGNSTGIGFGAIK